MQLTDKAAELSATSDDIPSMRLIWIQFQMQRECAALLQRLESGTINDSTIKAVRYHNKLNPLVTVTTKHVEAYVESLTEKMDQSLPTIRENVKFIKAAIETWGLGAIILHFGKPLT